MFQTSTVFFRATSGASAIIIGKTIGAGQTDKIRTYSRTLQLIFLGFGVISALIIMLLRGFIIDYYTLTPEARSLTRTFMLILAITVVGTSYEYPVMAGIIQSGGDTKYGMIVDTAFIFLFTLPLAYISAFVFHWPAEVTFMFLKSDQIVKCLPHGIKVNRYRWIRVLTREV
jgi:Na+-driven multidrug efflux pump